MAWAAGAPSIAGAQSVDLTARTVYHAYQVQLYPLLNQPGQRNLNRFYQTLDVAGWGLALEGDIDAALSLRYRSDFGTGFNRDTPARAGIPAVDDKNEVDILFMYVDWRNIVNKKLHLRFGRQVLVDDLAWYVFDGAKLLGTLWRSGEDALTVEVYGGVPVRFDALFSSDPFLSDGYKVPDNTGFLNGITFGGASFLRLFNNLSVSLAYRQVLQIRSDSLDPYTGGRRAIDVAESAASLSAGKLGLQEHRVGMSAGYTIRPLKLDLFGHFTWDLLFGNLDQGRIGVGYNPMAGLHTQVEWLHVRPLFAGDSIFNIFNIFPYDRVRAELSVELIPGLWIDGGYYLQHFGGGPKGPFSATVAGNEGAEFAGSSNTHGPSGGIRYRAPVWGAGAYFETATNTGGEYAYGGNYRLGYVYGDVTVFDGRLTTELRLSYNTVQNDWFERIDEGNVDVPRSSYVLGFSGRGKITDWLSTRVTLAKNFDSVLAGGYRVYTELAVQF